MYIYKYMSNLSSGERSCFSFADRSLRICILKTLTDSKLLISLSSLFCFNIRDFVSCKIY